MYYNKFNIPLITDKGLNEKLSLALNKSKKSKLVLLLNVVQLSLPLGKRHSFDKNRGLSLLQGLQTWDNCF